MAKKHDVLEAARVGVECGSGLFQREGWHPERRIFDDNVGLEGMEPSPMPGFGR